MKLWDSLPLAKNRLVDVSIEDRFDKYFTPNKKQSEKMKYKNHDARTCENSKPCFECEYPEKFIDLDAEKCKDMSDVCELAHNRTIEECRKYNVDVRDDEDEYTTSAQVFFDKHYNDIISKTGL